ncbi:hypothetical protein HMPREF2806_09585 [Corynebacterium sp. HMSC076G08]|uniref:hypothetical protein n=1 Tax=Corynebacterium sp. HMSC076G08 TaxID=1739310 RepID=UPI0008A1AD7D|nr:hypothetical protein [Corynebacterium sp. HMSC076G08]OFK66592.1 hypothetical protein HMPREF2806_09585 [Corynebacterium sp. HMSC076G08]
MPTVTGVLQHVTQRPDTIDEVWVRAPEVRGHSGGLITRNPDRYKVVGGNVQFQVAPGPAILVMVSAGNPVDSVKMFIGTGSSQTLADAVKNADLLDENSVRELDRILREIQRNVNTAAESAAKAKTSETNADSAASRASSSASSAKASENRARSSAGEATLYAQQAGEMERAVSDLEKEARSSAKSAKSSQDAAKTSETKAASSATSAGRSATTAASETTKALQKWRDEFTENDILWVGDRLGVSGKLSPPLTGPKGAPGDVSKSQMDAAITAAIVALAPTGLKLVLAAPDDKTAEQADTAIRAKGYQAVVVVPTTGNWWE